MPRFLIGEVLVVRQLIKLVVLNHRVVSSGKMVGFLTVEGERAGSYWF